MASFIQERRTVGPYYVYILTNKHRTVFYTGFTDDIERRVGEHKENVLSGFTKTYNCDRLVYFEEFGDSDDALSRESKSRGMRDQGRSI